MLSLLTIHSNNYQVLWGDKQIGEVGTVTADTNELQHHPSLPFIGYHLPAGDFLIAGKHRLIGVERKEFSDLLNTFTEKVTVAPHQKVNRLGHQLGRVIDAYGNATLIIEWHGVSMLGPYYLTKGRMRKIRDTALWGYLDVLQEMGVHIRITTSLERTVAMLETMLKSANTKRLVAPVMTRKGV